MIIITCKNNNNINNNNINNNMNNNKYKKLLIFFNIDFLKQRVMFNVAFNPMKEYSPKRQFENSFHSGVKLISL